MVPPNSQKLKMKLAIVADGMTPFVQVTYRLEGNGFVALTTYGTGFAIRDLNDSCVVTV